MHKSSTLLRTSSAVFNISSSDFFKESITSLIRFPIYLNCSSLNPLVVPAAVPILILDVTNGDLLSNGIEFLLQVMPASSKASSANFPVTYLLLTSISNM